jgi:hypothetical protein
MSDGEEALWWWAKQIYSGDIYRHLGNLDDENRRLVIEVLAEFAGVDIHRAEFE